MSTRTSENSLFLLSAVSPFLLAIAAGGATPIHAEDRALVVGVDSYANADVPQLEGCERDAQEMMKFLIERLGFRRESVHVLVNSGATAARIESEFRSWLISGTQAGDRVFFSYSGHGSRLKRTDGTGSYHSTLAPHDVNPETGANEILDATLRELVNQLSNRRGVLVFDACHSGSITRSIGDGGAGRRKFTGRYLPPPEEFVRMKREKATDRVWGSFVVQDSPRSRGSEGRATLTRNMFLRETTSGASNGIITVSAAADDQVAYPFETDGGTVMGALTSTFLQAAGDGRATVGEITRRIRETIPDLQRVGRLQGQQTPQFDIRSTDSLTLERQPLFGTWRTEAVVALQNPASTRKVSLQMSPSHPGQPYLENDLFAFTVQTDREGRLYILNFSPDRTATCLIPNPADRDNFVKKGPQQFPRKGEEFFVKCPAPAACGKETAIAIVSTAPLDLGDRMEYTWDEVFERVKLKKLTDLFATSRSAGVTSTRPDLDWQAAAVEYETGP